MRLVCSCCSRRWNPDLRACESCGATYPINLDPPSHPPPRAPAISVRRRASVVAEVPGIRVDTLDGVEDLVPLRFDALLSDALGGIVPGMTLLVWGQPGAGKSTLAAELGAAMARDMGGLCYWLDREQLNKGLIKACFSRTSSPTDRLRIISPRSPRDPHYAPATWRDALGVVPAGGRGVVVVDSLQTWAGERHSEQAALMQAVQGWGPTVIVISHATKGGEALGRNTNRHAADATVKIGTTEITVTKCRWIPCPRIVQRPPLARADMGENGGRAADTSEA